MRLAVVGNGPSTEGHGAEIDACDFVVRMKAWWIHGAEDAGTRCDAHVHYALGPSATAPEFTGEHWFSQTVSHLRRHADRWERLEFLVKSSRMGIVRWFPTENWNEARLKVNRDPTTGFVAVCMAMAVKQPDELLLYGFDGTTPDRPNYTDANGPPMPPDKYADPPHNQLAEKRAIAEMFGGMWMGKPTTTKLILPDMPELA